MKLDWFKGPTCRTNVYRVVEGGTPRIAPPGPDILTGTRIWRPPEVTNSCCIMGIVVCIPVKVPVVVVTVTVPENS